MQTFFIILILAFGFLITFQIAKASEYVSVLRGEEKARKQTNRINAFLLLAFLVIGLIGVYYCNERLKGKILGESASVQGDKIDTMLYITPVSYTHLRAHETPEHLVCRLLLEKKK